MYFDGLTLLSFVALMSKTMAMSDELLAPRDPTPALERRGCSSKFGQGDTKTYGDFTGCWSQYSDGSGTYVRTADVHKYGDGTKCWTDQFYTTKVPSQGEWTFIGGGCSSSDCFSSIGNSHQTCATTTWSGQIGLDYSIIKDIFKITGSASHESSKSECTTSTWTTQCRWTDGKCHNLWVSDSQIMYKGYIRRRCNYGDGDKTVWAKDYDAYVPTGNSLVGCNALCSDDAYPEPLP